MSITVAIPSIPGRSYSLAKAVESAAMQTRPPDVILVVVDHQRHGAYWARNVALAQIITDYVAWLDDDDVLLPNHLEVCERTALETGADLVYPGMIVEGGRDPLATPLNGVLRDPFGRVITVPDTPAAMVTGRTVTFYLDTADVVVAVTTLAVPDI